MYEVYNLQDGDTIEKVASSYGTTKEIIYQLNGIDDSFTISPYMQLVVPKRKNANYWYYTVKKGDNPYNIAKENGIDYKILLALNGLDEGDYIYPNQTLLLPNKGVEVYMTQNNDTIRGVMDRYDVGVDELVKENDKIYLMPEQIIMFRGK